jgi:ketosteroid isomerase-like protein
MRNRSAALLIPMMGVLACTGAGTGGAAVKASSDPAVQQAIEGANAGLASAFMVGDVDRALSFYDEEAMAMPPGLPADRGHEAIRKGIAGFLTEFAVSDFTLTTEDVQVAGDLAVETGSWKMTLQPSAAGATAQPDNGKYVAVWKLQEDGSWKMLRDIWNSDNPPPAPPPAAK